MLTERHAIIRIAPCFLVFLTDNLSQILQGAHHGSIDSLKKILHSRQRKRIPSLRPYKLALVQAKVISAEEVIVELHQAIRSLFSF